MRTRPSTPHLIAEPSHRTGPIHPETAPRQRPPRTITTACPRRRINPAHRALPAPFRPESADTAPGRPGHHSPAAPTHCLSRPVTDLPRCQAALVGAPPSAQPARVAPRSAQSARCILRGCVLAAPDPGRTNVGALPSLRAGRATPLAPNHPPPAGPTASASHRRTECRAGCHQSAPSTAERESVRRAPFTASGPPTGARFRRPRTG